MATVHNQSRSAARFAQARRYARDRRVTAAATTGELLELGRELLEAARDDRADAGGDVAARRARTTIRVRRSCSNLHSEVLVARCPGSKNMQGRSQEAELVLSATDRFSAGRAERVARCPAVREDEPAMPTRTRRRAASPSPQVVVEPCVHVEAGGDRNRQPVVRA
jgi:hypothetical protein